MVKKQTRMADIKAYGDTGIEIFNQIESKLISLVEETATVEYNGQRARNFKETCCANAQAFGETCSENLRQMSRVVSEASSFIAQNLGGQALELEPPTVVIDPPAIVVDEELETADSSILTTLRGNCDGIYKDISKLYVDHLDEFTSLGSRESWIGPEYDDALSQIQSLTDSAITGIEESYAMMDSAIDSQMTDLKM